VTLLSSLAAGVGPEPDVRLWERTAFGVRTLVEVQPGERDDAALQAAVEAVFASFDELEAAVDLWSPESALSRWNAGEPAGERSFPEELAPLLETALAFAERSDGAFDPTVGRVLEDLGFYGRAPVRAVDDDSVRAWRRSVGHARLELDTSGPTPVVRTTLERPRLDLSGLAKGVAAQRARRRLRAAGVDSARIALGGSSVCAFGPGPEGRGWPVVLPAGANERTWWLRDEALSTSGRLSLTLASGGREHSHVIDPRTCRPVDHRTSMVAVVGPDPVLADAMSTALLVLGADAGTAWFEARPGWPARWTAVFWSVPADDDPSTAPRPEIVTIGRAR